MKHKISLAFVLLACSTVAFGQMEQYSYQRKLEGITTSWHKLVLPDSVFGKVSPSLADIRIFGITEDGDTTEAPYLLEIATGRHQQQEAVFTLLNQSQNDRGYFYTFQLPPGNPVNQIKLAFGQPNFDWRLKLEGSSNQEEWFTIVDNYRILSIKNGLTDYAFTTVSFPLSNYRYLRLLINSSEKPALQSARLTAQEAVEGAYRNYALRGMQAETEKQSKQTVIDARLKFPAPLSYLKIFVRDTFDYYRPITINYVRDSINTQTGWKYRYAPLASGTLSSFEENEFSFSSTILDRLQVIINNQDNQPLQIDSISIKGYVHELVARFSQPAAYYLVYGNPGAGKPEYDIEKFSEQIPKYLTALQIGPEISIRQEEAPVPTPFFQHKGWLWLVMALIILSLGWFSLKMMRNV